MQVSEHCRLVHITTVPGSLNFVAGQPRFLAARGFVTHAISSPGEGWKSFLRHEPVVAHAVLMPRCITPLRDLVALWRVYRLLRAIRPHIVQAHTPKGGLLGMLAAWLAGVPVRIYTMHGLPLMTARGWKRLLLLWTERVSCWCASRVLSVSRSIRTVAIDMQICQTEKIDVLLGGSINGVDSRGRFDPSRWGAPARQMIRRKHGIPENALLVGFVGRIVRDKGMVELAGAWRKLRDRFPTLHLLLAGPFEPQDPVPPEVEQLFHSDPRIHLAGHVDEVAPCYAAMDVCVLPTYREGFPGVLLEAAAMELPVVATRIPGCVDAVVDGTTGMLVPPRDTESLAAAVAGYLVDPELRRRHGRAARQRVLDEFQQEAIWQAFYEEYLRLLEAAGLPAPTDAAGEATRTPSAYLPKRRAA
jgi:glycosyltransferase involved in cell wall biosynthesis